MTLGRRLVDVLMPQDCVVCAGSIDHPLDSRFLCAPCGLELPRLPPHCPRCAAPSPNAQLCGECLVRPPHFDATIAALRYTFPNDRLIQAYKYSSQLPLAEAFAALLAEQVKQVGTRAVLILPMPLATARLRERGFNQSWEIARRVARRLDLRADPHAASRTLATLPQTDLAHSERTKNVRGAFTATTVVMGMHIAIVDDVMTTGATANELARTLKRAGALSVENWVVARAISDP